jgi:hypothetical protein
MLRVFSLQSLPQLDKVTFSKYYSYINKKNIGAGWSSLVARWAHNPKVVSSNLAPATK